MSEQLAIDFDPEGTAAALAAEAALDIAYAELVANQVTTVAEARTRGLRFDGDEDCLVTVRVCPACADWEANEWLIGNNHGIDRCYLEHQADSSWATSGRAYGRTGVSLWISPVSTSPATATSVPTKQRCSTVSDRMCGSDSTARCPMYAAASRPDVEPRSPTISKQQAAQQEEDWDMAQINIDLDEPHVFAVLCGSLKQWSQRLRDEARDFPGHPNAPGAIKRADAADKLLQQIEKQHYSSTPPGRDSRATTTCEPATAGSDVSDLSAPAGMM